MKFQQSDPSLAYGESQGAAGQPTTVRDAKQQVFDLYWLALLITGHSDAAIDVAADAVALRDETSFFSTWMAAWSRRVVIARALAIIRDDLAASARRTASARIEPFTLPPRPFVVERAMTKCHLEPAVLGIDAFPRCALVLSTFENVPIQDAVVLLDAEPALIRKAQILGLCRLTRNLQERQSPQSIAGPAQVWKREGQHVEI